MIVNGVIVSEDKNKYQIGKGLKLVKANGFTNTKWSGLTNIKKYGSGLKILQQKNNIFI